MKKVFITFIFVLTVIFFHAACMGQGNKSDINVIFIGNSITQGVLMEQPEKNAPPVRCAQYLANAPGIGNVEIFNAGLSGVAQLWISCRAIILCWPALPTAQKIFAPDTHRRSFCFR